MKTRAPELRALIIIFGSAGPVISATPVVEVGRRRGNAPVFAANLVIRVGPEVRHDAAVEELPDEQSVD